MQGDEVDKEEEEEEEKEEEEEELPRKVRGQHKCEVLLTLDRNELLNTENDADVLQKATENMDQSGLVEWPGALTSAKTVGLWNFMHTYTSYS